MSGDRVDLLKKINTLEAENKALQDSIHLKENKLKY